MLNYSGCTRTTHLRFTNSPASPGMARCTIVGQSPSIDLAPYASKLGREKPYQFTELS